MIGYFFRKSHPACCFIDTCTQNHLHSYECPVYYSGMQVGWIVWVKDMASYSTCYSHAVGQNSPMPPDWVPPDGDVVRVL